MRKPIDDFCVFILTHGRPDKVYTFKALEKCGYTGEYFFVVDDEDETAQDYIDRFGIDRVILFSKDKIAQTFDEGGRFKDRRSIVYARNVCFDLAKEMGFTYFIELDDDYSYFRYKFNAEGYYKDDLSVRNLDKIFEIYLDFYTKIPALCLAMSQGGDFIGGKQSPFAKARKLKRKAMNTLICSVRRPFKFLGRINEDVNTYTNLARRGGLFLTTPNVAINQVQTQANAGGMTEIYLDSGTYLKSFYSVMYSPSCVKIAEMGSSYMRLHHRVSWNNATPVILNEKYKKGMI